MKIIEPKIELTEKEVKAINIVISLCSDLNNLNRDYFKILFDEDVFDGDLDETIETLDDILTICKLEKK